VGRSVTDTRTAPAGAGSGADQPGRHVVPAGDEATLPPGPGGSLLAPEVMDPLRAARASFVGGVAAFGDLCALTFDSVWLTVRAIARRTFAWREFLDQAWFLASVSVVPTVLIAIPIGLVIVLEVGSLANQIGATSFIGAVDATATVSEVAPIVTALLLAGAGGSAICSDLGARTIRDEIAALNVMGIDPVERLVAPRVLATVVVALLLNGIVAFAGITSGYVAAVTILGSTAGGFLGSFSIFAQPADIVQSMIKAVVFAIIASTVASYKGLNVKRGAAGVGEAVNQSVVITGVVLFLVNLVITDIFIVLVPPRIV
jgi:phospholipid/cholesterol/gamma-HCH transport system permease protein